VWTTTCSYYLKYCNFYPLFIHLPSISCTFIPFSLHFYLHFYQIFTLTIRSLLYNYIVLSKFVQGGFVFIQYLALIELICIEESQLWETSRWPSHFSIGMIFINNNGLFKWHNNCKTLHSLEIVLHGIYNW